MFLRDFQAYVVDQLVVFHATQALIFPFIVLAVKNPEWILLALMIFVLHIEIVPLLALFALILALCVFFTLLLVIHSLLANMFIS